MHLPSSLEQDCCSLKAIVPSLPAPHLTAAMCFGRARDIYAEGWIQALTVSPESFQPPLPFGFKHCLWELGMLFCAHRKYMPKSERELWLKGDPFLLAQGATPP